MITSIIDTEIWEGIPEKPGYVRHVGQRTIKEVFVQVKDLLPKELLEQIDYFLISGSSIEENKEFPYGRWVAVYPVIGDCEGHYIHVDVIAVCDYKTDKFICEREHVFTGKTFGGFDIASQFATELSRLFNDEKLQGIDIRARYIKTLDK